jgi:alkylation response protein AidB-like acyl-CoA dehydrogenase
MATQYVSMRHLQFLLYEVLDAPALQRFPYFEAYDRDAFDMALDAARQIGDTHLFPYYRVMDKNKAYYDDNGEVKVDPCVRRTMEALGEGGWISAPDSFDFGGQQMPMTLLNAGLVIFYAANSNAATHAFLTQGAANLLRSFGSETLQHQFIPNMYAGAWQGTMALTEPQAGSSLSDITTSAKPHADGYYLLKGQKIYISGGDHNGVDNIVHLMLARIEGAPAGAKGISLFVVPKLREENGAWVSNDVTTAGIYGKMGQKGYVAAHLQIGEGDDCRGYLVGEPHRGLSYMFRMMNEARIATGLMAAATASGAYYAALEYTRERPQGRHPSNKDLSLPQVLIIEHADVRRMLLFQKAVVEGSFALLLQCSYYADLEKHAQGEERRRAHLLLELLTPIAKSYPSEMGTLAVSAGMQCLGGAGYCDDFPLEQYYRDIRVNSIYEGTTGIHGIDLLGRKVMMENGEAAALFAQEISDTVNRAMQVEELRAMAIALGDAAGSLQKITLHLFQMATTEKAEVFLADATLYLEYFGHVTIGWQWLKQAIAAHTGLHQAEGAKEKAFYESKILTAQYFMEYELPKTKGLHQRLQSSERVTMNIASQHFD